MRSLPSDVDPNGGILTAEFHIKGRVNCGIFMTEINKE